MSKKWETITFDQIKTGDRIKVTNVRKYGTRLEEIGTAYNNQFPDFWYSPDDMRLVGRHETTAVIERRIVKPAPEPLPTKTGSVILVHEIELVDGTKTFDPPTVFHLRSTGHWEEIGTPPTVMVHGSRVTKWEYASIIPTSTLYK